MYIEARKLVSTYRQEPESLIFFSEFGSPGLILCFPGIPQNIYNVHKVL